MPVHLRTIARIPKKYCPRGPVSRQMGPAGAAARGIGGDSSAYPHTHPLLLDGKPTWVPLVVGSRKLDGPCLASPACQRSPPASPGHPPLLLYHLCHFLPLPTCLVAGWLASCALAGIPAVPSTGAASFPFAPLSESKERLKRALCMNNSTSRNLIL